jgi:hypothetical protein
VLDGGQKVTLQTARQLFPTYNPDSYTTKRMPVMGVLAMLLIAPLLAPAGRTNHRPRLVNMHTYTNLVCAIVKSTSRAAPSVILLPNYCKLVKYLPATAVKSSPVSKAPRAGESQCLCESNQLYQQASTQTNGNPLLMCQSVEPLDSCHTSTHCECTQLPAARACRRASP